MKILKVVGESILMKSVISTEQFEITLQKIHMDEHYFIAFVKLLIQITVNVVIKLNNFSAKLNNYMQNYT